MSSFYETLSLPVLILVVAGPALAVATVFAFVVLRMRKKLFRLEQVLAKKSEDLAAEREKREALLANFLPKVTAEEIMSKGKAAKAKYNFVTVLFSDIQGFTQIAEETNPEVLIDELDKFFFHFDSVVEKYGIEKIKTIGDAYMCAGGIPEKNRANPVEVVLAAMEMRSYMEKLKATSVLHGMKYWDIRIGIHTGPVVAGVVGQKKLSFDIWGDTVNTASRMESSGEGGRINVSGTTYEFVKEFFTVEYRGRMPVKYKGELEMYFVNGILPELCGNDGLPNEKFNTRLKLLRVQDLEEMVIRMFEEDAPPNLYFHNAVLVRNICNQCDLIINAVMLPEEDAVDLKVAAVFLLAGYVADYSKPMEGSLILLEKKLPEYGFSVKNVESAKRLIENSFTNRAETLSDRILHDARYDYLGRVDYIKLTERLFREMAEFGWQCDRKAWLGIQKKVLEEHDFLTETARMLRSVPYEEQLKALSVYES